MLDSTAALLPAAARWLPVTAREQGHTIRRDEPEKRVELPDAASVDPNPHRLTAS